MPIILSLTVCTNNVRYVLLCFVSTNCLDCSCNWKCVVLNYIWTVKCYLHKLKVLLSCAGHNEGVVARAGGYSWCWHYSGQHIPPGHPTGEWCCWCLLLVSVGGVCWWCLLLESAAGVCCWSLLLESAAGVCCWCLLLVLAAGVCWWCLLVVSAAGVCWWCLLLVQTNKITVFANTINVSVVNNNNRNTTTTTATTTITTIYYHHYHYYRFCHRPRERTCWLRPVVFTSGWTGPAGCSQTQGGSRWYPC